MHRVSSMAIRPQQNLVERMLPSAEDHELIVIEDDQVHSEAISRALAKTKIRIPTHYAIDGGVALSHLLRLAGLGRSERAVLILDLCMPMLDGIELLRHIRSTPEFENATVFVFTGSEDPNLRAQAEEFGVDGYYLKSELTGLLDSLQQKVGLGNRVRS